MTDVGALYQELILEHHRNPRNTGKLTGATHSSELSNPLCGDRTSLTLRLEAGKVQDARCDVLGCAICRASSSMLTEAVIGKLNLMPPGRVAHERLEQVIRLLLEMIRKAVCGRYRRLPLTTLADFLTVLHYFMKWRDRRPDTWDGGYVDDLELALETLGNHQSVVTAYRNWKAGQQT